MRSTRLVTMLVSLAMLGLPALVLGAGPASATDYNYSSEVTIGDPGTRIYGGLVKIAGQVVVDDGAGDTGAIPGATVALARQWAGSDAWEDLGTAVTDDTTGTYTFTETAKANATYKVTYAGETRADGTDNFIFSGSEMTRAVSVMRDLNAQELEKGNRLYFKGNVDPGWGGKVIKLQRKTCKSCAWKAYDKQLTGSTGSWKFRVGAPRTGSWYFRAKVAGTTDFITSYSAVLRTYML